METRVNAVAPPSGTAEIGLGSSCRRNPAVVRRTIGGEVILVPVTGELASLREVYVLNGVGDFVWERLDGTRSLEGILEEMIATFDADRGTLRGDLLRHVSELVAMGLVAVAGR
jgi:hypothetical protein